MNIGTRGRRHTGALLIVALAALAAGCQDQATPTGSAKPTSATAPSPSSSAPSPRPDLGTVHKDRPEAGTPDRSEALSVKRGERFSIAMRQNASARADWSLAEPGPSAAVLRAVGQSSLQTAEEEERDGAGYTEYFTFEAVKAGQTRIVFANSAGGHSPDVPRTVTYQVTIR